MGRDSSVSIATCYGLEGGGDIFRTRPDWSWGPLNLLYKGYRVFPGAWRGIDHPSPSSAEVKESVELYLHSLFEPSWPVRLCGSTSPKTHTSMFITCPFLWTVKYSMNLLSFVTYN